MIIDLQQNTPAWLEFRKKFIGSSDSPKICGISPYCTPLQLWEEKKDLIKFDTTPAMQRGHDVEDEVREKLVYKTGYEYKPKVFQSAQCKWMIASIDGVNELGDICEIKYNKSTTHQEVIEGTIPLHHIYQMQHQMFVCDVGYCDYVSYNHSCLECPMIIKRIYRDEKIITEIFQKTYDFWTRLQTYEVPEATYKDLIEINDREFEQLSISLFNFQREIDFLEKEKQAAKDRMLEICDKKSCKNDHVRIRKCYRKGTVDYSKIPELKEIDLEQYRKPLTEYYRFDIL